jgi:hypothetical protein
MKELHPLEKRLRPDQPSVEEEKTKEPSSDIFKVSLWEVLNEMIPQDEDP